MRLSSFEGGFFIEIVGIIVDPADIHDDKEVVEVIPKHEEGSIIFIGVAQR